MKTKRIVFIGVFTAILCILSPISIPTIIVPVTLSVFAIFITGLILPMYDAVIVVLIYILIGGIGLPVFAGYKGGFAVLVGPTGGYILSYPIMVLIISFVREKKKSGMFFGLLFSLIMCYTFGTLQLAFVGKMTFYKALCAGVIPFVAFDIIKLILALFVSKPLQKISASFYKSR